MKVYGIKNCNTVKKALEWLKDHNIDFEFHDFKKSGISEEKLRAWSAKAGWEPLINKKGTTWKKLDPEVQESIVSEDAAYKLMLDKTSVIKRPVIETGNGKILLGFNEHEYSELLNQ